MAGALDFSIIVQNVGHTGAVSERVYEGLSQQTPHSLYLKSPNSADSFVKSIHLLCSKSSYSTVYHLLYPLSGGFTAVK